MGLMTSSRARFSEITPRRQLYIIGTGGKCSPKTGQKVVFIEGEKGFFKNPYSKGIFDPETGLKMAKGLSGPTVQRCSGRF